ncbi:MAG TPA: GNAT family N-acetyltransferase [Holophagaceae bacterium]|nr:GNAT family N-acetyltransferase [Holophagaceae bacterium]
MTASADRPAGRAMVREAGPDDIPEIIRTTNEAYAVESFCIRGERTDVADVAYRMGTGAFLVVDGEKPGELLGSVYMAFPKAGRGYLGILAVDPKAQGRGISRLLVEAVEARCRAAGCLFLDLTVVNLRKELFPFYAKLGFTASDVLPFPRTEKLIQPCRLVQMTKALRPLDAL